MKLMMTQMSKLETPRRQKSDAKQDLRRKLEMVPAFPEPKLNCGNLESRLGRDVIGPWLPGIRPHSTRPFFGRNVTWQDRGTGNTDEEEEDGADTHEVDDPNNQRRK